MSWIVVSGPSEATWAMALGVAEGFTMLFPTAFFGGETISVTKILLRVGLVGYIVGPEAVS
ncbi:hypothetical protein KRR55_18875 [Paeniglutamicibacter sp. ABSL32-1]|uniref:hypothetical protein n=1 Tax=Paeniglutamicibacter quisquiliarum TaxID=2849498 RepID=UPI001C2DC40D|nr:hypothetical protein [Paeniglutamicibacter quisquiliarum]MBV1781178.1 hypothetical protein [Paeniglutamicibacter quisquiliarum]